MTSDAKNFLFDHLGENGDLTFTSPLSVPLENSLASLFRQTLFLSYLQQCFHVTLHGQLDRKPYSVIINGTSSQCRLCKTFIENMNVDIVEVEDYVESDAISIFPQFLALCRSHDFPHSLVKTIVENCAPQIFHVLLRFLQSLNPEEASQETEVLLEKSVSGNDSTSAAIELAMKLDESDLLHEEKLVSSSNMNATKNNPIFSSNEFLPMKNCDDSSETSPKLRSFSCSVLDNVLPPCNSNYVLEEMTSNNQKSQYPVPYERKLSFSEDEDDTKDLHRHVMKHHNVPITREPGQLRPVIIDGQNVAFTYMVNRFTPKAMLYAVRYFQNRGHDHITVIVPKSLEHQPVVRRLHNANLLRYVPRRIVNGQVQESSYDLCIIETAMQVDGVILSNNQFRKETAHRAQHREFVEKRLLLYYFSGQALIIPQFVHGMKRRPLEDILTYPSIDNDPITSNIGNKLTGNSRSRTRFERPIPFCSTATIDMAKTEEINRNHNSPLKPKTNRKRRKPRHPSS